MFKKILLLSICAMFFASSNAFAIWGRGKKDKEEKVVSAKLGDIVKVNYTGSLEDGTVFDSSIKRGVPFEFKIGDHKLIQGFEDAFIGMEAGEKKTVSISKDKAYGEYRQDLLAQIEKTRFAEQNIEPKVGQRVQVQDKEGRPVIAVVKEVTETSITLDANHPLAGKNLVFEIELVEVV